MYYILFIKFKLSASNNSQVHKYKKQPVRMKQKNAEFTFLQF